MVRCEFVEAFAKPYPSHGDRDGDGRAARGRAAAAPLVQLDPAAVRRDQHGHRDARASSRRSRSSTSTPRRWCARGASDPRDDLISKLIEAEEEGERLSDVECINLVFNVLVGGVDTSQSQLAHAIRLLAEHPRAMGAAAREDPRWPTGRRGGAALRADHAVHRTHPDRGGALPRRDVPGGDDRDGVRVHGQPRPRRGRAGEGGADSVRHHRGPRTRARADVRRRRALLPGRQPRARGAAGGPRRSCPSACTASSSTASPCSRASRASTAWPSCRSASRSKAVPPSSAPAEEMRASRLGARGPRRSDTRMEMSLRTRRRRRRSSALALTAAAAGGRRDSARGRAAYHVYGCRTPSGQTAPADGWSGSSRPAARSTSTRDNTCAEGGALVAALGDARRTAPTSTWPLGRLRLPPGAALSARRCGGRGTRRAASLRTGHLRVLARRTREYELLRFVCRWLGCAPRATVAAARRNKPRCGTRGRISARTSMRAPPARASRAPNAQPAAATRTATQRSSTSTRRTSRSNRPLVPSVTGVGGELASAVDAAGHRST